MDIINKIALGGVTALGVLIIGLLLSNAHLKTQLAESRAEYIACRMANDLFVAQVAKQNKAVDQLKADNARREKRAQQAASEAQEKARLFYVAAEKIRKTQTRGDACKAADSLFNAYLRNNK